MSNDRITARPIAPNESRGAYVQLQLAHAPCAEDNAADGKGEKRTAHVNEHERPRICLKRGEDGDGRVLRKQKCEPANERDLQSGERVRDVEFHEEPGQRVVHNDGGDNRDRVWDDVMWWLDIGHGPGVVVQPRLAKQRIPSEPDEEMNRRQGPKPAR